MNYPIDPEALWCTVCRKPIPDGQEFVSISIAREAFIPDDRTYSPVFHGVIAQYHIACVPRVVTFDISAHLEAS